MVLQNLVIPESVCWYAMRLHKPFIAAYIVAPLKSMLGAINLKSHLSLRAVREKVEQDERACPIVTRFAR